MLANKYQITDIHEATRAVCLTLKSELGNHISITALNQGRYKIVRFQNETILICYKREMYLKFEEGRGESINSSDLLDGIDKYNIKRVFFCYADSKIYCVSPHTILSQGIERTTDAEDKAVYSFNVKLLLRYNEFQEATI